MQTSSNTYIKKKKKKEVGFRTLISVVIITKSLKERDDCNYIIEDMIFDKRKFESKLYVMKY